MRLTPLVALSFLLAIPTAAQGPVQGPRSLPELIDLAMKEGKDEPLMAPMAKQLGLPEMEFPKRKLRYKQSVSPDRKEHSFGVIYSKDGGREKPTALLITTATAKKEGDKIFVDGHVYYATLKGKVQKAFRNKGEPGALDVEKLKVDSKLKKAFDSELEFHRKVAPALGLAHAQ